MGIKEYKLTSSNSIFLNPIKGFSARPPGYYKEVFVQIAFTNFQKGEHLRKQNL